MIDEGFTQKEMLIRIMGQLEGLEVKMNETHNLALSTNGKVKLHQKLIFCMGGAIVTFVGWFVYYLTQIKGG